MGDLGETDDQSLAGDQILGLLQAVVQGDLGHGDTIFQSDGVEGIPRRYHMDDHGLIPA